MDVMMLYDEYKLLFETHVTNGEKAIKYYGSGKCLILPKNRVFIVGMDQSYKQTGIFIRTDDNLKPMAILMDIKNKGLPSRDIYTVMLGELLKNIFWDVHLKAVFVEMPVEGSAFTTTKTKLIELKGFINALCASIPSMRNAQILSITPGAWRKHYLQDDRYKGRRTHKEDLKVAAEEEGVRRYSQFSSYSNLFKSTPDSFDAIGILEGGLQEIFYNGDMRVRRYHPQMHATVHNINAYYDVIDIDCESVYDYCENLICECGDFNEEEVEQLLLDRDLMVYVVDTADKDFDEVVRAIISQTNSICLIVFKYKNDKYNRIFKWVNDIEREGNQAYCCVAWRKHKDAKGKDMDRFDSYIELPELFEDELMRMEDEECTD